MIAPNYWKEVNDMRLIDADKLTEKIHKIKFQTNISEKTNRYRPFLDYGDVLDCINEQATIYSVEEVVTETRKLLDKLLHICALEDVDKVYSFYDDLETIIRKGGTE